MARRPHLALDELAKRKLLSVNEATRLFPVSRAFIDELIAQRKIDFIRPSPHRTMVVRESLERYLDRAPPSCRER